MPNAQKTRSKAAEKYLKSNDKNTPSDDFKKAWIEYGKQCFLNGYTGFMLNDRLYIPTSETIIQSPLMKIFNDNLHLIYNNNEINVDIGDIKAQIRIAKVQKQEKCIVNIGICRYNAKYLLDCYNILGSDAKLYQPNEKHNPSILTNENGYAILFPIK